MRIKAAPTWKLVQLLEKHCRRNTESFAQFLYMRFVEVPFLVQDFGHDAFRTKDRDQVFLPEIISIHQRAKDFHRGSARYGMMLFFVCLDQSYQDFGVLLFSSPRL